MFHEKLRSAEDFDNLPPGGYKTTPHGQHHTPHRRRPITAALWWQRHHAENGQSYANLSSDALLHVYMICSIYNIIYTIIQSYYIHICTYIYIFLCM